jgi:acyl carrier protein
VPYDTQLCSGFISSALSRILNVAEVTTTDDFFALGGDSLAAVSLMVAIEDKFGIVLDPVELFERPRLDEFSGWLSATLATRAAGSA